MARKFFLVAAGMFLLALSYHLGASTATAQAPGNPVVTSIPGPFPAVVTANGDVYYNANGTASGSLWTRAYNVFTNSAQTSAQQESSGQVKARFYTAPGMPVTPGAGSGQ
jgi:hypothetical protein